RTLWPVTPARASVVLSTIRSFSMCGIGYFVGSSAATTTRRAPRLFRKRPHRRARMWSVPNVYAGSVTLFFFPRNFSSDGYVELGFCLEIVELRRRRLVHNIV